MTNATSLRAVADWINDLPGDPLVRVGEYQTHIYPRDEAEFAGILGAHRWEPSASKPVEVLMAYPPEVGDVVLHLPGDDR